MAIKQLNSADSVDNKVHLSRMLGQLVDSVKAHPADGISCDVQRTFGRDGAREWTIRVTLHPEGPRK